MAIQTAVYLCHPIPTAAVSPDPSSEDSGLWSPLCCTLIYTPNTAILVDCPASVNATNELASWLKSTLPPGCTLKYFIASHAHGDHFLGIPILKAAFPSITPTSTESVVEGIAHQYSPETYKALWEATFPPSEAGTGVPETKTDFVALPASNEIILDGHLVKLHDVPHGDTHAGSFIHVPDLGLVVAGDIVYNGDCHQWLGEASTQEKRDKWVEALSQIEALKPRVVVPGHTFKPTVEPNEAIAQSMLNSTRKYIKAFEEELEKAQSEVDLFKVMKSRFPRWNLWILSGGCRAGIMSKQSPASSEHL
ncbi:metallo-beta-lactamase domain protein [Colletotrichum truncatum]|uniref:Metallo-beta-lactamase domain protein n=1 Tax=Colletotrichum truncatum TaxID=5467 RepID=A0ACC3ZB60_COLTU|nr:metallo-beta-lactamase domain protein [Colletotrichum truncatum]KAF6796269.1 metallo-beta-lactamase domain protein [Colletotrichum truncatum]